MNPEICLPKIPVSVLVVIHDAEGRILLLERAGRPGYWQSVTGSLDRLDEDLRHACVREVAEETGIVVGPEPGTLPVLSDWRQSNLYEIFPQWRHRYAPGITQNLEHVFSLLVEPGTLPVLAPREHVAWRWAPWREAADACFSPSNAQAIRDLAGRLGWSS